MADIQSSPLLVKNHQKPELMVKLCTMGVVNMSTILAFVNMWIILHMIHSAVVGAQHSTEPVQINFSGWVRAVESLAIIRALINITTPNTFKNLKEFECKKYFLRRVSILIIVINISLIAVLSVQIHQIHLEKKEFPEDQVFTPHWMGGMIAISSIDTLMVCVSMGMWWRLKNPKTTGADELVIV